MDTVRLLYMRYGEYLWDTISMHYVHGVKYELQWAWTSEKISINPPSPSTIIIESARIFNFNNFFHANTAF